MKRDNDLHNICHICSTWLYVCEDTHTCMSQSGQQGSSFWVHTPLAPPSCSSDLDSCCAGTFVQFLGWIFAQRLLSFTGKKLCLSVRTHVNEVHLWTYSKSKLLAFLCFERVRAWLVCSVLLLYTCCIPNVSAPRNGWTCGGGWCRQLRSGLYQDLFGGGPASRLL